MTNPVLAYQRVRLQCCLTELPKLRRRIIRRPYPVHARPERRSLAPLFIDRRHTGDIPLPERSKLRRDHQVERVKVDLVLYRHERLDLTYAVLFGIQVNLVQEPYDGT